MSEKISPHHSSSFDRLKTAVTRKETERSGTDPRQTVQAAISRSASDNTSAAGLIAIAAEIDPHGGARSEVAKANEASSRSSVRDVERAADLARKVANRIASREDEALGAIKEPEPERVKDLLS